MSAAAASKLLGGGGGDVSSAGASATPSAAPSVPGSPKASKRQTSALPSKDKKAAEEAALAAAAAQASMIPASAQPASSADQTNVHVLNVACAPFKLLVNSNALAGVVLDYIRERSIKGVNAMMTARLTRVRDDLVRLTAEEATNERLRTTQIAQLSRKQAHAQATIQRLADTKFLQEAAAAATAATSASPTPGSSKAGTTDVTHRGSPTPDSGDERKEDGATKRAGNAKEKEKPVSKAVPVAKKKGGKAGVPEVEVEVRSPEEEVLHQINLTIESSAADYAAKLQLLTRERDVLTAENAQLTTDLLWVKQLFTVGSVVPPPPPAPRPPSAVASTEPMSPSPVTVTSPSPVPSASPSLPSSAAASGLKARRLKASASGDLPPPPPLPSSASLAPVGGTFLGVDLWQEDRTPCNLRLRPLASATTLLRPKATYQLVAVYALPGVDPARANLDPQSTQQVPISFFFTPPPPVDHQASSASLHVNTIASPAPAGSPNTLGGPAMSPFALATPAAPATPAPAAK